jgi:hypothetical protein
MANFDSTVQDLLNKGVKPNTIVNGLLEKGMFKNDILKAQSKGKDPSAILSALRLKSQPKLGLFDRFKIQFGDDEGIKDYLESKGFEGVEVKNGKASFLDGKKRVQADPKGFDWLDFVDIADELVSFGGMALGGAVGTVVGAPLGPGGALGGAISGAGVGGGAAEFGIQSFGNVLGVRSGLDVPEIGKEAAIGATSELGGQAIAPVARGITKTGGKIISKTSGVSEEALARQFAQDTGAQVAEAAVGGTNWRTVFDEGGIALKTFRNRYQKQWVNEMEKLGEGIRYSKGTIDVLEREFIQEMERFGIYNDGTKFVFDTSRFAGNPTQANKILKSLETLKKFKGQDLTPKRMNDLKIVINDFKADATQGNDAYNSLIGSLSSSVKNKMNTLPEVAEINAKFGEKAETYQALIDIFPSGFESEKQRVTKLNKLKNIFGENREGYLDAISELEGAGFKGISEKLRNIKAGSEFAKSGGLRSTAGVAGSAALGATGNPLGALASFVATNPSLLRPVVQQAGKIANSPLGEAVGTFLPKGALQQGFKAIKENSRVPMAQENNQGYPEIEFTPGSLF